MYMVEVFYFEREFFVKFVVFGIFEFLWDKI